MGEDEIEVSFEGDDSFSPEMNSLHSAVYHPDQLNREPDYTYKCRFLYSLGLQRVTPERRRGQILIVTNYQKNANQHCKHFARVLHSDRLFHELVDEIYSGSTR